MTDLTYGGRVRLRVNGLLVADDAVLLVQIHSPVTDELIWTPPGGGLEFGETLEACLKREFQEETGLKVEVQELKFINELLEPPFHAVEFYFTVSGTGGELCLGADPEHRSGKQLLKDIRWMPVNKLDQINLTPDPLADILTGKTEGISHSVLYSSFLGDT